MDKLGVIKARKDCNVFSQTLEIYQLLSPYNYATKKNEVTLHVFHNVKLIHLLRHHFHLFNDKPTWLHLLDKQIANGTFVDQGAASVIFPISTLWRIRYMLLKSRYGQNREKREIIPGILAYNDYFSFLKGMDQRLFCLFLWICESSVAK